MDHRDETTDFPAHAFQDVIAANAEFVAGFQHRDLTGKALRGLAVITCMDSRIEPLSILGMQPGDVKIIRNAGARVTDDILRTLVLASHLLNVHRVLVMPHTDCRMASGTEAEMHDAIREVSGIDTRSLEIRTTRDQLAGLAIDLQRIRSFPLLPADLVVAGAVYDAQTGALRPFSG